MITVEESIYRYSKQNPTKIAIKNGKEIITYRDLWNGIINSRDYFLTLPNYQEGKIVFLTAGKQSEFLFAYFGAHLARLIVVPIDPDINQTRFNYICEMTNPFCVIGFDKINISLAKIPLKLFTACNQNTSVVTEDFPSLNSVSDILFTTGTTGNPKGVPLTYENEAAAVLNINSYVKNTFDDVELLALPLSHSFGLGRIRCCLSNGQTLIILGSFVNTKRIFKVMQDEFVTGFSMVPSSWKYLQKMAGNQLGSYANQLKYIEMGSAYFSESDKKELADLLPNTRITMHYGLTEASRSAFTEFHEDKDYLASVGRASPNTDIKIFDEKGNCLPVDVEGEICIKGSHVTNGYLKISNEETFFGEYFRTGDWGYINSEGYIYLKSRKKELINVGGKKVSPQEVEDQILKIDGVSDCACIAVPDPDGILGEVVKAYLVFNPDKISIDSIRNKLIGNLELYKIPVFYDSIDSIPRTGNGKIKRDELR